MNNRPFDPSRPGNPFAALTDQEWELLRNPPRPRTPTSNGHATNHPAAWPQPQPLPTGPNHPEPFNEDLLPPTLRAWMLDIAERMQVPLDYPGVGMMIMAGAALGRRVGIRPKQFDDWTVVANLWGALIGRPGLMKSPALDEALKPLKRLEAEAAERFRDQHESYDIQRQIQEAKASEVRKRLRESSGSEIEARAILEDYAVEAPRWQRHIVNDPSPEKLGEILRDNPQGILLFRDELAGWFASLQKAGNEGARKFYLEAWNGTGGYTFDRIGRGTVRIEHVCVSLLGSIQPGVLQALMREGLAGGASDDGLLQRFQLFVWPDPDTAFSNIDRPPNAQARQNAFGTIRRLATLVPTSIGATLDDDPRRAVPFLRFDQEAQDLFNTWRARLETRIRSGEEHPAFESHLAKYRSLVPALALIYHVAAGAGGPVRFEATFLAMEWARYLESHARRIYGPLIMPEVEAATMLAHHLRRRDLPEGFTLRDVYRKGWSGLTSKHAAQEAAETLVALNWLEATTPTTGGRPTRVYAINPRIFLQNGRLD